MDARRPDITVNGVTLTMAETMTLAMACRVLQFELQEDAFRDSIGELRALKFVSSLASIRAKMENQHD